MSKILMATGALALSAWFTVWWLSPPSVVSQMRAATHNAIVDAASEPEMLFIVHEPKDGCPDGWRLIPNAFDEANGTHRGACTHGTARQGGQMDYLLPGESFPGIEAVWAIQGSGA